MTGLLDGTDYTTNQASYDLARLRLNGLITRIPGKNRYRLTGDGLRFASSTPNCTTDYYARCLPPTGHPPRHHTKSIAHHRHSHRRTHRQRQTAAQSSLKTQDKSQRSSDQGSLAPCDADLLTMALFRQLLSAASHGSGGTNSPSPTCRPSVMPGPIISLPIVPRIIAGISLDDESGDLARMLADQEGRRHHHKEQSRRRLVVALLT